MESLGPGALHLAAPAKINLNLLVGPRRTDGFHPIDSYVAKITVYDEIDLRIRNDGRIHFTCRGLDCGSDEQNLALRAAKCLAGPRDVPGADIVLTKHIAPGSGMGGGSSDTAAVLWGLNELWQLGLSAPALAETAMTLGSDVPLFLGPPAARMTGRGEHIEPIGLQPFRAILYVPDCTCRTGEVYNAYDAAPPPEATQQPAELLTGAPPSRWRRLLVNQLAEAALSLHGELARAWAELTSSARLPVCLTGSGSAMFILCDSRAEADSIMLGFSEQLKRRCLVVQPNPW